VVETYSTRVIELSHILFLSFLFHVDDGLLSWKIRIAFAAFASTSEHSGYSGLSSVPRGILLYFN